MRNREPKNVYSDLESINWLRKWKNPIFDLLIAIEFSSNVATCSKCNKIREQNRKIIEIITFRIFDLLSFVRSAVRQISISFLYRFSSFFAHFFFVRNFRRDWIKQVYFHSAQNENEKRGPNERKTLRRMCCRRHVVHPRDKVQNGGNRKDKNGKEKRNENLARKKKQQRRDQAEWINNA